MIVSQQRISEGPLKCAALAFYALIHLIYIQSNFLHRVFFRYFMIEMNFFISFYIYIIGLKITKINFNSIHMALPIL